MALVNICLAPPLWCLLTLGLGISRYKSRTQSRQSRKAQGNLGEQKQGALLLVGRGKGFQHWRLKCESEIILVKLWFGDTRTYSYILSYRILNTLSNCQCVVLLGRRQTVYASKRASKGTLVTPPSHMLGLYSALLFHLDFPCPFHCFSFSLSSSSQHLSSYLHLMSIPSSSLIY